VKAEGGAAAAAAAAGAVGGGGSRRLACNASGIRAGACVAPRFYRRDEVGRVIERARGFRPQLPRQPPSLPAARARGNPLRRGPLVLCCPRRAFRGARCRSR
jgi:hypothetical protein